MRKICDELYEVQNFIAHNYVAYFLSDNNGCSIKIAKYAGTDRVYLIENREFGYCSIVKATDAVLERLNIENMTFTNITYNGREEVHLLAPKP